VHLTCSLGASWSDAGAGDPGALLSQAETAMKAAKSRGPGGVAVYESDMGTLRLDRFEMEHALRQALERSELLLHYQPIVDLTTGRLVGLEALVRWQRPGVGLVPPAAFIPLAEETGLINPLGAWVLREAARQFERWSAQGIDVGSLELSVNVSVAQLADRRLEQHIDAALETMGPDRLRLEITESVLMDPGVVEVLQRIHDRGVTLAVDDFGTGYSSLSYLTRFPIDALKVDRAFVAGLEHRSVDRAVAAAVVGLARALELETVGEGVETPGQLAALRQLGCDRAQGYLFAAPLPPDELAVMLRTDARFGTSS
jgi:EAL domain-containing protein (putative c-di-GMP-specific phosphodiesterase class I)